MNVQYISKKFFTDIEYCISRGNPCELEIPDAKQYK